MPFLTIRGEMCQEMDVNKKLNEAQVDFDTWSDISQKADLPADKKHRRVKRFRGGNVSNKPDVGIIFNDDSVRIHPHDPILFHGSTNSHLTREQLKWEKIYELLRKRGQVAAPQSSPGITRESLLECTLALRSQSPSTVSSGALPSKCEDLLSSGTGGTQRTQGTPSFPNVPHFGGSHTHQGSSSSFPGFPSSSSGHVHGNNGFSPQSSGHAHGNVFSPQSNGHVHGSNGFSPQSNGHAHGNVFSPQSTGHVHGSNGFHGNTAFLPQSNVPGNNGFPHQSHVHGNNGQTIQTPIVRNSFGSRRPVTSSQVSGSSGHVHVSRVNNGPPIIFG
ncbi:hypothetical protein SK128_002472 [Halocaridina rubra]|uniref:Uncharacterized protein n=1 Tax=Halocaridina rubra TaxID=373956 RepID=A0AAN9A8N8_HALRR